MSPPFPVTFTHPKLMGAGFGFSRSASFRVGLPRVASRGTEGIKQDVILQNLGCADRNEQS